MNIYIKLKLLFIIYCLFAVNGITMHNKSADNKIYNAIKIAQSNMELHKECHVNIFNLVNNLKKLLSDEDFSKIKVGVFFPYDPSNSYEGTYLPNTIWLHHVVLIYDNNVFDFFNIDKTKKYDSHEYDHYIYENFFDFRKSFKNKIYSYVSNRYDHYKDFFALNLIEPYRKIEIESYILSGEEYLSCVENEAIQRKKLEQTISLKKEFYKYDKRKYINWYKHKFDDKIDLHDSMLLWSDLYELHWEELAKNAYPKDPIIWDKITTNVTNFFNWPELIDMENKWKKRELTGPIYFDLVIKGQK